MFKYFLFLFLAISSLPISAGFSIRNVTDPNEQVRVRRTYTFGKYSPDHEPLSAQSGVEYHTGHYPTLLSTVIRYQPYQKIIKYVELDVYQDTYDGSACITGGGIGKKKIEITAVAYETTFLEYNCHFYGRRKYIE